MSHVDEQTRASCLNDAIRAHGGMTNDADHIVATAAKFYAFVTGKRVAKEAKRKPKRR